MRALVSQERITNSAPIFHHDFTNEFSLTTQLHRWKEHRLLTAPADEASINRLLQLISRCWLRWLHGRNASDGLVMGGDFHDLACLGTGQPFGKEGFEIPLRKLDWNHLRHA